MITKIQIIYEDLEALDKASKLSNVKILDYEEVAGYKVYRASFKSPIELFNFGFYYGQFISNKTYEDKRG